MYSFLMVAKGDRPIALDLICRGIKDTREPYYFYIEPLSKVPAKVTCQSKFLKTVSKIYPKTKWSCLRLSTASAHSLVAKIPSPNGRIVVWRNGWNCGSYNFAIYFKKNLYFRENNPDTLALIRVMSSKKEDLPLFLNTICEKNKTVVMNFLKGDYHETRKDY